MGLIVNVGTGVELATKADVVGVGIALSVAVGVIVGVRVGVRVNVGTGVLDVPGCGVDVGCGVFVR